MKLPRKIVNILKIQSSVFFEKKLKKFKSQSKLREKKTWLIVYLFPSLRPISISIDAHAHMNFIRNFLFHHEKNAEKSKSSKI